MTASLAYEVCTGRGMPETVYADGMDVTPTGDLILFDKPIHGERKVIKAYTPAYWTKASETFDRRKLPGYH